MRHILSTALVALVVGSLAGATVGTLARSEPSTDRLVSPAARVRNADKVDGRHAVGAGASRTRRAGKLVATNKHGYLPANIVKPRWKLIQGMPSGFADGTDNAGVTGVTLTTVVDDFTASVGMKDNWTVRCPTGARVTGGGYAPDEDENVVFHASRPVGADGWRVVASNLDIEPRVVTVYALCLSTKPAGALTTASRRR